MLPTPHKHDPLLQTLVPTATQAPPIPILLNGRYNSAHKAGECALTGATTQRADGNSNTPLSTPMMHTSCTQAARELLSQTLGRLAGAGTFTGLNRLRVNDALIASGTLIGALSAGVCGGMLLRHQIGMETTAKKAVAGTATVAVMVAGGLITGYASTATVSAIASGAVLAMLVSRPTSDTSELMSNTESSIGEDDSSIFVSSASTVSTSSDDLPAEEITTHDPMLTLKAMAFVAGATPTVIGFVADTSFWLHHDTALGARNLSVAVEALTIEIIKSTIDTVGISVNRETLMFEEKIRAMLMGVLPYVIASVLFNSVAGSLLQAELQSNEFKSLIAPALVGVLANCVKGAANAAALRYVGDANASLTQAGQHTVRPHQGLRCPDFKIVPKTMLRYLMISCRDSLFIGMKKGGVRPEVASALSMAIYAGFAQFRELAFELLEGKGWSEPAVQPRPAVDV